ncbi:hypothetical protein ACFOWE_20150 [Planomonospora corallina]|uniref:Uncharacterized protein n=1 Tax=Planomonospora corallina TaxID=1806052 RepID=A0ABV8I8S7_9ACTN
MDSSPADPGDALSRIITALSRLALPAEEQIEILKGEGLPVDELALDYEVALSTLWVVTEAGLLDDALAAELIEIDGLLDAISGFENEDLWTERALRDDRAWRRIRERAQAVLSLAGIRGSPGTGPA